MSACSFCQSIESDEPAIRRWDDRRVIAYRPTNPLLPDIQPDHPTYTDGHFLVVPRDHIPDAPNDPEMAAVVAQCAIELASDLGWTDGHFAFNVGPWSGRSSTHMVGNYVYADETHRHVMPWTGQQLREAVGNVDYYVSGQGDESVLQLWRGPARDPVSLGYKTAWDRIDPLLWVSMTAILQPTPFPTDPAPQ